MRAAFIVRPFGSKRPIPRKGKEGLIEVIEYNFDRVEKELIKPAMRQAGLNGGTTGEVFAAGDIREDMFSSLLLADLVIADITIYNPNVFYELGIRHALRNKSTILIKSPGFDDTPFDIIGYRYLTYDKDNPGEKVEELVRVIIETLHLKRVDSPVFNVLPLLEAQDTERFLTLPPDFVNEVEAASKNKFPGKLAMLGMESEGFSWHLKALKFVGQKLFKLQKFELAKGFFQKIINHSGEREDLFCRDRLSTILQRLAEKEMTNNRERGFELLTESDVHAERIINSRDATRDQRAEAYALLGRNYKTKWISTWRGKAKFRETALESSYLSKALDCYKNGFILSLNHFYSGLNALALNKIMTSLAKELPETWEVLHSDPEKELEKLYEAEKMLSATLKFSLEAERKQAEFKKERDIWLDISEVDYQFLTSQKFRKIASDYRRILTDADDLAKSSVSRQLRLYKELGILNENVNAVLAELGDDDPSPENCYILFTGHMIDKPGRATPRFPVSGENAVTKAIKDKIIEIKASRTKSHTFIGVAGGASGGDIIFHEQCRALGIDSIVFLAFSKDDYKVASVLPAGVNWGRRFDDLLEKGRHFLLGDSKELPNWLKSKADYNIWQRNNLWELNYAFKDGASNMTLLALWDMKKGDGPGGTEDMVNQVRARGGDVEIIDIGKV